MDEASIEKTDLIKPSATNSYIVRSINGAIVKVTDSLDEAISTAIQYRDMKLALGEPDAHCNVEQKVVVYSTMNIPYEDQFCSEECYAVHKEIIEIEPRMNGIAPLTNPFAWSR